MKGKIRNIKWGVGDGAQYFVLNGLFFVKIGFLALL